jgi:hypothetical protein
MKVLFNDRFTELSGPSFYVTVLGQDELQGPLKLNVSFDTELDFNGAYPELLYWDYGESVLRLLQYN